MLEGIGVEITDPDTGETLGKEVGVKITVRVVRVEDAYSVAESAETIPGRPAVPSIVDLFSASASIRGQPAVPARRRTMRTEEALFPPLTEAQSYVKRGDPVRQILE